MKFLSLLLIVVIAGCSKPTPDAPAWTTELETRVEKLEEVVKIHSEYLKVHDRHLKSVSDISLATKRSVIELQNRAADPKRN